VFLQTDSGAALEAELLAFMDTCVYPAEPRYDEEMRAAGNPHHHPAVLEQLKAEARRRLWNLFHPHANPEWGSPGLSNLEYAPLAEIMGRSPLLAPEAGNCAAPDTGNMELLELFGIDEHRSRWLRPLLDGTIRSCFAMTEPVVASSDATNIELRMVRLEEGEQVGVDGLGLGGGHASSTACSLARSSVSAARVRSDIRAISASGLPAAPRSTRSRTSVVISGATRSSSDVAATASSGASVSSARSRPVNGSSAPSRTAAPRSAVLSSPGRLRPG